MQGICHRERRNRPLPPLPLPWDGLHRHAGADVGGPPPASRATAPVPPLPSIGPGRVCPVSRTSRREKMARSTRCLTPSPHHCRVLGYSVSGSHARSCLPACLPWRMLAFRNGPFHPLDEGIPDPPEQDRAWSLAGPRTEGRTRDSATGIRSPRRWEGHGARLPARSCGAQSEHLRWIDPSCVYDSPVSWRWEPSSLVQRPCSPPLQGPTGLSGCDPGTAAHALPGNGASLYPDAKRMPGTGKAGQQTSGPECKRRTADRIPIPGGECAGYAGVVPNTNPCLSITDFRRPVHRKARTIIRRVAKGSG